MCRLTIENYNAAAKQNPLYLNLLYLEMQDCFGAYHIRSRSQAVLFTQITQGSLHIYVDSYLSPV